MKTVLLSAGDLSGEQHAAEMVRALRRRQSGLRLVGMGGESMAAAGVELFVDQRQLAVGGIFEVLGSLPRVVRAWRAMTRCVRETKPDVVVLVDSGGFNLPFARFVRRKSKARILYYVAPQVWAWRSNRIRKLAVRMDRIAVILPFEASYYKERGIEVEFVGHPAIDALPSDAESDSVGAVARAGLAISPDERVLGVFPGSRRNEVARHLPRQLEAFMRLREMAPGLGGLKAIVGLAPSLDADWVRAQAADHLPAAPDAIRFVSAGDGSLLDACDVALVKPGTIAVELMLRCKPMVVMGLVHPATAMIARRSLKVDWVAMPNLIAGREIVPELLQEAATRDRIAAALAPLFTGEARDRQIAALESARGQLGRPGAADRVASIVEDLLGTA